MTRAATALVTIDLIALMAMFPNLDDGAQRRDSAKS
jgi:hypothetical protein